METRKIHTNLHGKEEAFKIMALGESLGIPVLLHGPPGVAKTQVMLDYAAAVEGGHEEALKKSFVLELDEGTRPSEVRGMIDMEKLTLQKKYDVITPIADKDYVMINEVDKGTSAVRNTMLSAMRERKLMLGNEIRNCKWKLFVGTCNKINDDPDEAPYWDRWMLKMDVNRVPIAKLADSWGTPRITIELNVCTRQEIDAFVPSDNDEFNKCVNAMVEIYYNSMTDRTAWHIPTVIKACHLVYGTDMITATIKAASIMSRDNSLIKTLASKIEDPAITKLKTEIQRLAGTVDANMVFEVMESVSKFKNSNKYSQEKKNSIIEMFKEQRDSNPQVRKVYDDLLRKKKEMQQGRVQSTSSESVSDQWLDAKQSAN